MSGRDPRSPPPHRAHAPRFWFCKVPNDFPDYPVLRAAALKAKVPVHQIVSVALRLECLANASEPRGSVADFSVPEFAASLQLRPDVVARIRATLEDPDIFWIDQDFITGFHARNPESVDNTAVERQRRHRAKLKAEREVLAQATTGPPPIHSHVTSRRDGVTGHGREEKIKDPLCLDVASAGPPVDNRVHNASGAAAGLSDAGASLALDDRETAALWLEGEGLRIVTEQLQENRQLAATKIARWRDQELGGDAVALAAIIRGAEKTGLFGARFLNLIVDGIKDARRRATAQGELRLPVPVGERKLG